MSDPTRAVKCTLRRLCKRYSKGSVHSWSFPYQEMQCEVRVVTEANWEGELVGFCCTRIRRHSRLWRCLLTRVSHISTRNVARALEIRSGLAECDMTLKMMGKSDVTTGCAMAARRGVGRVLQLDARLSWLQRLSAEGVVHWCLRSSRPGENNEADPESKKIDSTLLYERNIPSTTNEFNELELYGWWHQGSPRLRQQETVVLQSRTRGTHARRIAVSGSVR